MQQAFQLHQSKPPMRQRVVIRHSKPPPRKTPEQQRHGGLVHFVFSRVHLYPPPRRRVLQPYRPDLIDASRFEVDPVRPYPAFPLVCSVTAMYAFDDENALRDYLKRSASDGQIYKVFTCEHCQMVHAECKPHELTGTSSGNSFRADQWLVKKGYKE